MNTSEELENATDVLNELTDHYHNLKDRERNRGGVRTVEHFHQSRCPRCRARSKILSGYPYCPDCSWDSLEDPCYIKAA